MLFFDGKRNGPKAWEDKFNWVDENNVFVGFDSSQYCCEDFRYVYLDESLKIVNDPYIGPFSFVPNMIDEDQIKKIEVCEYMKGQKDYRWTAFQMTDGETTLYLILLNMHNGYYCHGFELGRFSTESIYKGQL